MADIAERLAGPRQRHLTSLHLEEVRTGLATAADEAWAREHLGGCARCAALAAELGAAHQRFDDAAGARTGAALAMRLRRPPEQGENERENRQPREQPRRRRPWWALAGAGLLVPAAAGLLVVASLRHRTGGPAVDREGATTATSPDIAVISVKGGAALLVAVHRGERIFPVRGSGAGAAGGAVSGSEPIRPGDELRFVIARARSPFVLLGSVDSAGHASIYVPYGGSASAPLGGPVERVELPGSIVIDGSAGPERLFALLSRRPLEAAPVRAALAAIGARGETAVRRATRLDIAGADEQLTVLLEKQAP